MQRYGARARGVMMLAASARVRHVSPLFPVTLRRASVYDSPASFWLPSSLTLFRGIGNDSSNDRTATTTATMTTPSEPAVAANSISEIVNLSSRLLGTACNRLRAEYSRSTDKADDRKNHITTLSSGVQLKGRTDLDARTVSSIVSVLDDLEIGADHPLLTECADWVAAHTTDFSGHDIAMVICSLTQLRAPVLVTPTPQFMDRLTDRFHQLLPEMSVVSLAAIANCWTDRHATFQELAKLSEAAGLRLRDVLEGDRGGLPSSSLFDGLSTSELLSVGAAICKIPNDALDFFSDVFDTDGVSPKVAMPHWMEARRPKMEKLILTVSKDVLTKLSTQFEANSAGPARLSSPLDTLHAVQLLASLTRSTGATSGDALDSVRRVVRDTVAQIAQQPSAMMNSQRWSASLALMWSLPISKGDDAQSATSQLRAAIVDTFERYNTDDIHANQGGWAPLAECFLVTAQSGMRPDASPTTLATIDRCLASWQHGLIDEVCGYDDAVVRSVINVSLLRNRESLTSPAASLPAAVSAHVARLLDGAKADRHCLLRLIPVITSNALPIASPTIRQCLLVYAARAPLCDVVAVARALSSVASSDARSLLRDVAPLVTPALAKAAPKSQATLIRAFAAARVRDEPLCDAVIDGILSHRSPPLKLDVMSDVLFSLSVLDHRQTRIFHDLSNDLRSLIPQASPSQTMALLFGYAKASAWIYKLYARLAERAAEIFEDLLPREIVVILASLQWVNVRHRVTDVALTWASRVGNVDRFTDEEALAFMSVLSKVGRWDRPLFESIANRLLLRKLSANAVGELLLCFSRAGMHSSPVFDTFAPQAVLLAPTAPATAIAAILSAYAAARRPHEELFAVMSQRLLEMKDTTSAVTIARVLAAVASVGMRNDRLFVEMIPRVRHVAHHGGSQDVANVLTAYTTVNLWHYKLFTKLAERAISLRMDSSSGQIAAILTAFAKVDMKYTKLMTEMSPRIQMVMPVAQPHEVSAIAHAFASLGVNDEAVFSTLLDRARETGSTFTQDEASMLLAALRKLEKKPDPALLKAFAHLQEVMPLDRTAEPSPTVSDSSSKASSSTSRSPVLVDDDEALV